MRPTLPRRTVKDLPLTRLLPNVLTVLALCAGLTSIRFALMERWHEAVLAIMIAGVFDMLDGRIARMLNITSKFGAELDSLSDIVSFGVAPALIIYEWLLKDAKAFGWIAVLVYAVCVALRLARFNTMLDEQPQPAWAKRFFVGMPTPGGAGLALLPLTLFLEYGTDAQLPQIVVACWMMILGGLMVSRLPTMALKGWRVNHIWIAPIFVGIVFMIAELITNPWITITAIGVVYILSLPVGSYLYNRLARLKGTTPDETRHD